MIVTDVYVSFDDLTYRKLDLFKNEPITIKQTSKDLTDITKVFLPYSLSFTVQASDVNKSILDWFGYSKSLKKVSEYKFFCKIYTNHSLAFKGILKVNTSQFEDNKAQQFNVSFATTTTDLKALMKDDTLQDLASLPINFSPKSVQELLVSGNNATVDGVNVSYFIPFVSLNRVWSYQENDTEGDLLDNIVYNSSLSANNENLINLSELRPSVYLKSLFELIINKYNLDVLCPFFDTTEFSTINMWANEDFSQDLNPKLLVLNKQFVNENATVGKAVVNFVDNSIKVTTINTTRKIRYRLSFVDTFVGSEKATATIILRRKSDNIDVFTIDREIDNGLNDIEFVIPRGLFVANEFEFYTYIKFSKPITYSSNKSRFLYLNSLFGDPRSTYENNNTIFASGYNNIDLFKMLPKMKVIDFITSFSKTFNISIVNNNPKKNELFWLRKQDIDSYGLVYSKNTIDYTAYWTDNKIVKSVPATYNKYNFKHLNSKYFSNVKYKNQFAKEYGQVVYPETEVANANEMKIETGFSIIAPVNVQGLNLITAYGFTDASPAILESGATRYKPNFSEPTLFHRLNTSTLSVNIGVQSQNNVGLLINKSVNQVNRVAPFSSGNFSLAFSNIIFSNVEFTESLFLRYYANDIIRLTNPRVKLCNFNVTLPASEIDINEYTTVNATSLTPTGFRIQNDIIIEETKYSIIDSQIDLTTGKAKLQLLNY